MKKHNIMAMALTSLMALPVIAQDSTPAIGDILQGINMFTPEEDDPAYKVKANDKYGAQWAVDMAYGLWNMEKVSNVKRHTNLALLHAQLNQRLIEDKANGGTWLRVEFSGSWGLDRESAQSDTFFTEAYATASGLHADAMGPHEGIFPEVALMQYFAGKRACLIAGMVNLTNYFDAVSIANDSFSSFTNDGFVNSTILPLADSNVGGILQVELNRNNYMMVAVSRTGCDSGYNPFIPIMAMVMPWLANTAIFLPTALRLSASIRSMPVRMWTWMTGPGNAAAKMPDLSRALNIPPASL